MKNVVPTYESFLNENRSARLAKRMLKKEPKLPQMTGNELNVVSHVIGDLIEDPGQTKANIELVANTWKNPRSILSIDTIIQILSFLKIFVVRKPGQEDRYKFPDGSKFLNM
jgi:hypothetical protein